MKPGGTVAERIGDLLELIPDAVVVVDGNGGLVLRCNAAAEALFGRPAKDMAGMPVGQLVSGEAKPAFVAALDAAFRPEDVASRGEPVETEVQRPDGSRVPVEVVASRCRLEEARGWLVAVFRDVSGRLEAAERHGGDLRRREVMDGALNALARSQLLIDGEFEAFARELVTTAAAVVGVERCGVWLFDPDRKRLVCVVNFEKSTGDYSAGECLLEEDYRHEFDALSLADYIDASDALTDPRTAGYVPTYFRQHRIRALLDAVIRSEGRVHGIVCLEHAGTPRRWRRDEVTFACQLAKLAVIAIARAERRKAVAEAATLRAGQERMALEAMDHIPAVVFALERGAGREPILRFVSRQWAALTGQPLSSPPGFDEVLAMVHAEDREALRVATGEALSDETPFSWEGRIEVAAGLRWVSIRALPWHRTSGGVWWEGVVSDITDLKAAEETIRQKAELKDRILRTALDGFVIVDDALRIKEVNDAYCGMVGYTREELLEMRVPEIEAVDGLEDVAARLDGIRARGHSRFETRHRRKDGELIDVEVSAQADTEGNLLVCFIREATDRNRGLAALRAATEQAMAADRAKSEFLAVMSHELRTPLHAVLGFAELLDDTSLDAGQREYVQTILSSGRHLLDLVSDILDLSGIERGSVTFDHREINLRSLLTEACESVRPVAGNKGLALECVIDPDAPGQMVGDAKRIRQIVLNLLSNAVKFTTAGSIALTLRRGLLGGGPCVRIEVADTGAGIAPDVLTRLFRPFEQADSTARRQYGGCGLGLAVSHRLALSMGGDITVASEPGRGSTFAVWLPLRPAPEHPPLPALDSRSGLAVLVAEDDRANRRLIGTLLDRLGCQVTFASDGAEAVRALDEHPFACVLMDIHMPVMDGIEAVRRIRAREDGSRIPIFALSANVLADDQSLYLAAGFDGFLAKPFRREEIADLVASVRARHHAPAASRAGLGARGGRGEACGSPSGDGGA